MLVSTEPMSMAESDHCGWPLASSARGTEPRIFSAIQSQAVQSDGKRNPQKNISSKKGAMVTPKANIIHAAPGELIIFSMGELAGPGIRTWSRMAIPKQPRAVAASGPNLESAALTFQCNPANRLSFHTIGKTKRLKPKVMR